MTTKYRSFPTAWLRIFLEATDNFFGHNVVRGQRVAVAAELIAREIQAVAEESGSYPALPVDGEQ